jgi:hypothetical protein
MVNSILLITVGMFYSHLFPAIRNNDQRITEVELGVYDSAERQSLLQLLPGNTHVTSLTLNVEYFLHAECKIKMAGLLQYLRQTKSTRAVHLKYRFKCASTCIVGQLVRSLAENPLARLVTFVSEKVTLPCGDLIALLQVNAHCLEHVGICGVQVSPSGNDVLNDERFRQVSLAVGSLSVVESLSLGFAFPHDKYINLLFGRLHSHSHLRKLQVADASEHMHCLIPALRSLLQSGVLLEELELCNFVFDECMAENLVVGLAACQSLVSLSFESCGFDSLGFHGIRGFQAICSMLIKFLRGSPSIRNVRLSNGPLGLFSVSMAASILSLAESETEHTSSGTVPSSLLVHLVHTSREDYLDDVLGLLSKGGSRLLWLTYWNFSEETQSLTRNLANSLRLWKLTMRSSRSVYSYWPDAFVCALRKNGSLHEVSVTDDISEFLEYAKPPQWHLVQSFCDRNCRMPILMARLSSDTATISNHGPTPMYLSISLYKAVSRMPRMASTWSLTGLLASGNAIGTARSGSSNSSHDMIHGNK